MYTKEQSLIVKEELKKSGIRQDEIANLFGVSRQFVNAVLNGKRESIRIEKLLLDKLGLRDESRTSTR